MIYFKYKCIILVLFAFIMHGNRLYAQQRNTFDYIYDGGHLVLDIFKSAKKVKADKAKTTSKESIRDENTASNSASFCFGNKSEMLIYIELKRKTSVGTYSSTLYELTIPSGEIECSLGLLSGVYHYKIQDKTDEAKIKIIKEGDVIIDEKEELIKEVK